MVEAEALAAAIVAKAEALELDVRLLARSVVTVRTTWVVDVEVDCTLDEVEDDRA